MSLFEWSELTRLDAVEYDAAMTAYEADIERLQLQFNAKVADKDRRLKEIKGHQEMLATNMTAVSQAHGLLNQAELQGQLLQQMIQLSHDYVAIVNEPLPMMPETPQQPRPVLPMPRPMPKARGTGTSSSPAAAGRPATPAPAATLTTSTERIAHAQVTARGTASGPAAAAAASSSTTNPSVPRTQ